MKAAAMRFALAGLALLLSALFAAVVPVAAQEVPTFRITYKDRRFEPERLVVPPGIRFVLLVRNAGEGPAEFESGRLGVEKIISAGREAIVRLGPLKPGEYPFMDDFFQAAKGVLVVSEE